MSLFDRFKGLLGIGGGSAAAGGSAQANPTERTRASADLLDGWPTPVDMPEGSEPASEPAARPQETSAPRFRERRRQQRSTTPEGTRIMIVDDSQTLVALLRKMLDQNQYETTVAHDAESALSAAFDDPPDLIFLDIVLPGMNGFEALRRLRRDERTRDVPVIMISGNEQAVEQFYAQRIGADDFMKKPFARSEVFARIEGLRDEAGYLHRREKGSKSYGKPFEADAVE